MRVSKSSLAVKRIVFLAGWLSVGQVDSESEASLWQVQRERERERERQRERDLAPVPVLLSNPTYPGKSRATKD